MVSAACSASSPGRNAPSEASLPATMPETAGTKNVATALDQSSRDASRSAGHDQWIGLVEQRRNDFADLSLGVDQIVELADQFGFVPDAVVDRLHRHTGVGCNVFQGRRRVAMFGETTSSGGQDVAAGLFGLQCAPPRKRWRTSLRFCSHFA